MKLHQMELRVLQVTLLELKELLVVEEVEVVAVEVRRAVANPLRLVMDLQGVYQSIVGIESKSLTLKIKEVRHLLDCVM